MRVQSHGRTLGVLRDDGVLLLSAALRRASLDDPWKLWALALDEQTRRLPPVGAAEVADRELDARQALLPADLFVDAYARLDDVAALARALGLPREILEDRLRDIDVELLTAEPLRGIPRG